MATTASLNTVSCVSGAINTNMGSCVFDPKNFVGAYLTPAGYVIPAAAFASPAALQTQLLADRMNDNKALRIYPITDFFSFKDSSEKAVEQKFDYGQTQTVRDGIMDWQFDFRLGGLNLSNALRSYNGSAWSFLFVDSKNQLVGTQAVDSTGANTIGSIPPIEFYQDPFTPNDGKKLSTYTSKFRFQPKFINELVAYVTNANFDIMNTIKGLQDVVLTGVESAVAGTYNVFVTSRVGGINIGSLFSVALASASLWTANNDATGLAITITSVTWNAAGGFFALALTVTSPPYPAVAGKIDINLVGPTELNTALVPGYESTGAVVLIRAV